MARDFEQSRLGIDDAEIDSFEGSKAVRKKNNYENDSYNGHWKPSVM